MRARSGEGERSRRKRASRGAKPYPPPSPQALDTTSEKLVQDSIDALVNDKTAKRTVIVIAHRLSTVRNADVVVVIDKGKLVEMGTWDELSSTSGGSFAAMLALQGLK